MSYDQLADQSAIEKTIIALNNNGFTTNFVQDGITARAAALGMIPAGAGVMTMTSTTLEQIGLTGALEEPGKYELVRQKLAKLDRSRDGLEMNRLGAAPEISIGSVHAVTQDGKIMVASNTGSQLPAYAYGASRVIWIVGAQKIVRDLDEGFRRIYEYCLAKESERARIAYGVEASAVNKILIFNREVNPERISIILVGEVLGF
jgi:hypothetical protein